MLLKECKYIEKKKIKYVTGNLESSSDDSNEEYIKAIKVIFWGSNLDEHLSWLLIWMAADKREGEGAKFWLAKQSIFQSHINKESMHQNIISKIVCT